MLKKEMMLINNGGATREPTFTVIHPYSGTSDFQIGVLCDGGQVWLALGETHVFRMSEIQAGTVNSQEYNFMVWYAGIFDVYASPNTTLVHQSGSAAKGMWLYFRIDDMTKDTLFDGNGSGGIVIG